MTRKILTAIVQRLVNLVSLDISGHIMLDNCTVPHFEEAMGRPRWVTNSEVYTSCKKVYSIGFKGGLGGGAVSYYSLCRIFVEVRQ